MKDYIVYIMFVISITSLSFGFVYQKIQNHREFKCEQYVALYLNEKDIAMKQYWLDHSINLCK